MDVNGRDIKPSSRGPFSFTIPMLLTVKHEDCKAQDSQFNK